MTIKSATTREIMTGKIKRLDAKTTKAQVNKMTDKQILTLNAEDTEHEASFKNAKVFVRGAVIGRPKKEIKREVISVRVPADTIVKIKSLGSGWSTRAGDALAKMANEGLL